MAPKSETTGLPHAIPDLLCVETMTVKRPSLGPESGRATKAQFGNVRAPRKSMMSRVNADGEGIEGGGAALGPTNPIDLNQGAVQETGIAIHVQVLPEESRL